MGVKMMVFMIGACEQSNEGSSELSNDVDDLILEVYWGIGFWSYA